MDDKSQIAPIDNQHDMPSTPSLVDDKTNADKSPWYAVRIFCSKQQAIADFFKAKDIEYFVPEEYTDVLDKEDHIRHVLRPVVRNLIFVKKTMEENEMRKMMTDVPYKISVLRKNREHLDYYEIPSKQMFEFRVMCNPDIAMRKYLSEEDAKLKSGTPVMVKFGPLKGLSGKLVRQSKKYYLLKEVPGMAVMIKVSRWCCSPMEQ
jgi:transcription antitermination factor NusG